MFHYCELSESNGNLVVLNSFPFPFRVDSRVLELNSLRYFSASNLVALYLKGSNASRISKIFHGSLPSLEILDLSHCKGILQSDIISVQGVPALSNSLSKFSSQNDFVFWETLNLSRSNWTRVNILCYLPSLNTVDLSYCESLDFTNVDMDLIQNSSLGTQRSQVKTIVYFEKR